ncbi:hypothetical protein G6F43_011863 [Rhizopus delemar]|nr:hypothetical protein G6F43_011863 [Rhizopus delemar]
MSVSNSDYNSNNNVDPNATFTLTEEQQEALYQQFAQRYQAEHPNQDTSTRRNEIMELPEEIWDELNTSSRYELQANSKRFIRDTQRYVAGDWIKTAMEAKQAISSRYDDSDKLGIVGRSAAEIFKGLEAYMESGDQETFLQVMEKRGKELTLTVLRLPQHAKHLEDQYVEDDSKRIVFSNQDVEKFHQERYESSILQNATSNQPRGSSTGWGNRGREQFRGRGFRDTFTQKPFFGRSRGRGFFNPPTTNNNYNSNNQNFSSPTNNNNQ